MQDELQKELTEEELSYIDLAAYQLYKKASDIKIKDGLKHELQESIKFEDAEITTYKINIENEKNENVKILLHGLAKNAMVRKLINEKLIELIDGQSNDSM
jgi:hypothetical protein